MTITTQPLSGLAMRTPLLIPDLLKHAVYRAPQQEIVSRCIEGGFHRYTYQDCYSRSCQLANLLVSLSVQPGDRIASMAWNTFRHMELYYGVSGIGAVLHTVNPRLFAEQIQWMLNDAEDQWLFIDADFVELIAPLLNDVSKLKGVIVLTDEAHMPADLSYPWQCYETLLAKHSTTFEWSHELDENAGALLCYTSGTTGKPKGVLSSHRALVLHAQATIGRELLDLADDTVLLPMVSMYHVGAWGAPYAAPLAGCKLVLPGNGMSGAAMHEIMENERVTVALGVPTIWLTLHNYLSESRGSLTTLERVCVGGAASPLGLVKTYAERYNVYWQPIWGMTETGPLVCSVPPTPALMNLEPAERYKIQTTAGRACFPIRMRIVDTNNHPLPHDGETSGELQVQGPWIANSYFGNVGSNSFIDGWLATGDIAVIDAHGYMKVVDRKKDVIKSGGEWISSLDIENSCSQHPAVNESCVIGLPHPKWDERPLLLVVLNAGMRVSETEIRDFLKPQIAKWWMPDRIIFVDHLPHTGTGKLVKHELREQYKDLYTAN